MIKLTERLEKELRDTEFTKGKDLKKDRFALMKVSRLLGKLTTDEEKKAIVSLMEEIIEKEEDDFEKEEAEIALEIITEKYFHRW